MGPHLSRYCSRHLVPSTCGTFEEADTISTARSIFDKCLQHINGNLQETTIYHLHGPRGFGKTISWLCIILTYNTPDSGSRLASECIRGTLFDHWK
jgi:ABC-type lipoprotein export system ATPase subunit